MSDGVGEGLTRADHRPLMEQLYAAYARAEEVRMMTRIVGEEDLSEIDRCYLKFGLQFEQLFLTQERNEDRSIEQSLDIGWRCLGYLPRNELTRLSADELDRHRDIWDERGEAAV